VSLIVDYKCGGCGLIAEQFVSSPPPVRGSCAACGGEARRLFSSGGLVTDHRDRSARSTRSARTPAAGCVGGGVPGACTMHPEVASVWSARVRGDHRALDVALERQDRFLRNTGVAPDQLARNRMQVGIDTGPALMPTSEF
jgi:hypothetical protein